jgi:adenosylhomocysteine nucleosidase
VDAGSGARYTASEGEVTVLTVASVSGPAEKRTLAERWKADVVDMEAAAIASVAEQHRLDFAAIKAISDESGFVMPPVGEFVDQAGKFATARFAVYVAFRPKWWRSVQQLGANSRLAAVNLSVALKHLIDERSAIAPEEKVPGA